MATDAEVSPVPDGGTTPLCSQGVPDILGTKRAKKTARSFSEELSLVTKIRKFVTTSKIY